MTILVTYLLCSPPALAQEEEAEPEASADIHLEVSKGLRGKTSDEEPAPSLERAGDRVVTEDGQQIAFIDLDPEEESELPSAATVALVVGGGMFLLGLGASLMMLRAARDEPESAE